jgi:hypothetical protein
MLYKKLTVKLLICAKYLQFYVDALYTAIFLLYVCTVHKRSRSVTAILILQSKYAQMATERHPNFLTDVLIKTKESTYVEQIQATNFS